MSDLNDDFLNYDIGDVIDDNVLIGADEDELLLSDDELEKDVSKEEKQKLKSEAEEWVNSQIKEKPKTKVKQVAQQKQIDTQKSCPTQETQHNDVKKAQESSLQEPQIQSSDNTATVSSIEQEFKTPAEQTKPTISNEIDVNNSGQNLTQVVENTNNISKEMELDQTSNISNSAASLTNDSCTSSVLQSSQESASVSISHGEVSDPREDYEEEREERTNIKTTSEREAFEHNNEHSPEKSVNRYVYHQKRNGAPLIRGHPLRGPTPPFQRPLLRFPPHGQPFPPPTQQPNTNPFAPQPPPNSLQNTPHGPMAGLNHDLNNPHHRPRHPFGFRPGPMAGFRHPNPTGMYSQVPHDYNNAQGPGGFNQHQFAGPRNVFRPEGPMGLPPGMRPGMRMQRPPLQALPPHTMPNQGNFINAPHPIRPQTGPVPQPPSGAPSVPGQTTPVTNQQPPTGQLPAAAPPLAPRKVLINPNFKGGVEAATSKFIQETQYMNAINTHVPPVRVQSDEELLRQQEEFINKNREHIEKRRHARDVSPGRRSRSRSRSRTRSRTPRSVSRERSYTPPKRHPNGGPNNRNDRFDRERDRDRERGDRDRPNDDKNSRIGRASSRDREDRDRDRNRPMGGYNNNRQGPNRFRRANSRDRDYENRNQGGGGGNYGKRRRSNSPSPGNRGGGGNFSGNRGRYNNDRDKSEVEEDEETRAYRLQIEKQKALREQIMRDKEMKRRRAAEEKQYEEKRSGGPQQKDDTPPQQQQQSTHQHQHQQNSQKLKEVVAERKIISLKKRPAVEHNDNDDHSRPTQRKTIPTAKILPEAKKTLTDHLTHNTSTRDGERSSGSNSISQNTAIIKPVLKKDTSSSSSATVAAIKPQPHQQSSQSHRRMSSHSEDEVQLDYDEDDLLLDEEDMLLASPEPTPPREITNKSRLESRTPSPEPTLKSHNIGRKSMNVRGSGGGGGGGGGNHGTTKPGFSSTNRRVVLKTSSNTSGSSGNNSTNRGRDLGSTSSSSSGGNSNSRRAIFERLDVRNSGRQQSPSSAGTGSGGNSDNKRKPQRIVLKHD
ncbi:uncharacterized protein ACRADG_007221 isoform 2-T2 [Cochliomyia hominivorax]